MPGRIACVAVAIAGLTLAGCGASGTGDPSPSSPAVTTAPGTAVNPSTQPTTTPRTTPPTGPATGTPTVPADVPTTGPNLLSAGEGPPVMPIEATLHTQAGAVAFAEFFIRTMDWGFATTNGAYMRHFFASTCAACASHADSLDATHRADHHYLGGRFEILDAQAIGGSTDESTARVSFSLTSVEVVDGAGRFVNGGPAVTGLREDIVVRWQQGHWIVETMAPS